MRQFLKKWTKYFIFAGILSLFINALALTFPIYMLSIYDRVLASYSLPTLITLTVGALFSLYIINTLLEIIRSRILVLAGVEIAKSTNRKVFTEMLKDACRIQKLGYSQGLRDVNTLRNYLGGNAIFAIFDIPWSPIYLMIIFVMNPLLGYVATGGAVLLVILGLLQEVLTGPPLNEANISNGQESNFVSTSLRNADAVRSMGMIEGIVSKWKAQNNEVIRLQTGASRHAGVLRAMSKSLRQGMQVMIYGLGAYLTLRHESTPGIMIAASIIMGRALAPVEMAMSTWKQTIEARAAYKRLDALHKATVEQKAMELPPPEGRLTVEGASLVVGGGRYILRNISFSLAVGEQLAIIGPSAAGKTTLCKLLLGIWPSMGGKVRLDGADIFQWDPEELGPYIGYLGQDVELFPGTISENIARMGEVDSPRVIEAAKKAGVHDMVLGFPGGYDTKMAEGAGVLSGGQRQRVGLARALYGNPRLVVLDEPNSNLDDAGELALINTLIQLKADRVTVILVTHKPSIVANVDKVLMLKEGQLVMFGPKDEVFQALQQQQQQQQQQVQQQQQQQQQQQPQETKDTRLSVFTRNPA